MLYWYLARPNELLLDLDEYAKKTVTGGARGEVFFRKRLREAIQANKLKVREVYLDYSTTQAHFHALVRLWDDMPVIPRMVWQFHLGSDMLRSRADLMRAAKGHQHPSLLIRSHPFRDCYRPYDAICHCTKKHVTLENPDCEVWQMYRGASPWDLFGPSSTVPELGVALPLGRVPLERILARHICKEDF